MKIDLTKEHKDLYRAEANKPVVVEVPTQHIISVTGQGDPDSSAYGEAIEALYNVAYKLKFASKQEGFDFKVMPLEGQWWADDPAAFAEGDRGNWRWRMFIVMPDFITEEAFPAAIEAAGKSKELPALDKVAFETIHEGPAAQLLHVGPFAAEAPTIERLRYFISETGHTFDSQVEKHHEIYLSDARRTAPEKLRTIIRQPFH